MNVAFIQTAEHNIDDQNGNEEQPAEIAQRLLELLGCSLKGKRHCLWQRLLSSLIDFADCLTERSIWPQIERQGHARELAQMGDLLRSDCALEGADSA